MVGWQSIISLRNWRKSLALLLSWEKRRNDFHWLLFHCSINHLYCQISFPSVKFTGILLRDFLMTTSLYIFPVTVKSSIIISIYFTVLKWSPLWKDSYQWCTYPGKAKNCLSLCSMSHPGCLWRSHPCHTPITLRWEKTGRYGGWCEENQRVKSSLNHIVRGWNRFDWFLLLIF